MVIITTIRESAIIFNTRQLTMRWIITLVYTILIFSTLGIARTITETIRATGNLSNLTISLIGLFLCSLLFLNINKISRNQFILRLILTLCFIILTVTVTGSPEERVHVIEYGMLGWLIGWSQAEPKITPSRFWLALFLGWTIGFGDEIIQYFLPNRVYDIRDIILNGVSANLGLFFFFTPEIEQVVMKRNR